MRTPACSERPGNGGDRQRTRNAGIDHHLVKPVSPEALASVLGMVERPETIGQ